MTGTPGTRRSLLIVLTTFAATGTAEAHIYLTAPNPNPRLVYAGNTLTTGPCGSGTTLSNLPKTHLQVGVPFNVQWSEVIAHPGHFRISLAATDATLPPAPTATPQNPAVAPILADGLFPHTTAAANAPRMQTITPTAACPACTLQVAQTVDGSTTVYYTCADVVVDPAGGGTGGAAGTGGTPGTGGTTGTGGRTGASGGTTGSGGAAVGSGGAVGTGGAGTTVGSGGAPGTGGATAGSGGATGSGGSVTGSGGALGTGGTSGLPATPGATDAGCACDVARSTRPGLVACFVGILVALSLRRRRSRNKAGRP